MGVPDEAWGSSVLACSLVMCGIGRFVLGVIDGGSLHRLLRAGESARATHVPKARMVVGRLIDAVHPRLQFTGITIVGVNVDAARR